MAVIFIEGFDKYGPPWGSTDFNGRLAELFAGEWTSIVANTDSIVAGLSATGYAVNISNLSNLKKSLGSNYTRLIGGFRFNSPLTSAAAGITFADITTSQASITVDSAGTISIRSGSTTGTVVNVGGAVSENTTHYIEFDITFADSGSYSVWLDGVLLYTGTGDFKASANAYANALVFTGNSSPGFILDDVYLFDSTGGTNDAALLTSPIVETAYPTSDDAVTFGAGAAALGYFDNLNGSNSPGANKIFLMPVTPDVSMTLDGVNCLPEATSAGAKFKALVYLDTAGAPDTLVATGDEVVGATSGTVLYSTFGTPPTLGAGTAYWIGFKGDTSVTIAKFDNTRTLGVSATHTYGSSSPNPAPAMTTGLATWAIWGTVVPGVNWTVVDNNPAGFTDVSYVTSGTAGDEDYFGMPALSTVPANIYAVSVKGFMRKSDAGARTMDIKVKSGTATSTGSLGGQGLGSSYGWLSSYFETDPSTSAAWGASGVGSAKIGYKIAT